jgi:hypothetical protein
VLYDGLPEPIDLETDPARRTLYWTDRGDPPRGNTVNRAPLDAPAGKRSAPEILFSHLMEGIGLALDPKGGRMFVTDFAGSVYSANLDGSNQQTLLFAEGNLTGMCCPGSNDREWVNVWDSRAANERQPGDIDRDFRGGARDLRAR